MEQAQQKDPGDTNSGGRKNSARRGRNGTMDYRGESVVGKPALEREGMGYKKKKSEVTK